MNKDDLGQFFEKYAPAIYRRARYLLGDHEDAQEATQEVFVRALRNAAVFEHRSKVSTWLMSITTNYCLNRIRDAGRRRQLWADHQSRNPEEHPGTPPIEGLVLIRRLLAEADETCARAAVYVYVDGMSQREAASVMGVSRSTVGNLLERFQKWAADRTIEAKGEPE